MGVRMDQILFVRSHAFDCIGAKSAGMHAAFVDRRELPLGRTPHPPDIVVPDMTAVHVYRTRFILGQAWPGRNAWPTAYTYPVPDT